jgi:hypothetical protein
MVYQALRHYADAGISARFISNVDPADAVAKLADLDPATTLFIVSSKTFSTLETLTNATAARRWLTDALGGGIQDGHADIFDEQAQQLLFLDVVEGVNDVVDAGGEVVHAGSELIVAGEGGAFVSEAGSLVPQLFSSCGNLGGAAPHFGQFDEPALVEVE